ncbi:uncharacterized protein A4U43_C01F5970 [Asparagus officinalis]|uniref:Homeobox-leucine zipper protein n=1 Tax=Asparagus officinalis TaxID=4686 RepID=A0A5P1FRW0_ASPOF|nr:homeobox-leucine zipper protein HOX16-like [Asparagus officinalis]ONK79400.1 uncharacterized protein A4U43_C01F5970 [Asparagus officinalis]
MDSGRLIFNSSSSSSSSRHGHMLFLGRSGNSIFQGGSWMAGMEEASANKRRPFFTTHEELLEEEYYDDQLPEKKRRLTTEQVQLLEMSFETETKLEPERKTELAKKLGLQPRQVAVWFQNRRARWKNKQLERGFDRLKAAYDSLLADHESLLTDNARLRSQITTLAEKLQTKELTVAEPAGESVTGSRMGGMVDGDSLQLVDSSSGSESYFHNTFSGHCIVEAVGGGGVHSEEDDGSDDGCNIARSPLFCW